jgi:hypothetical protein
VNPEVPATLSPADAFRPSSAVVARELEGELVLVRIAGSAADLGSLYVLNAMGTRIWSRLDGVTTLDTLVGELVATYEVAEEVARADTSELLASLLAAHLIERRDGR